MKITSVRQQQKRSDRYSIYLDGIYTLSLSETELLKQGLKLGEELDASDLKRLKNDAIKDKAYDRSLNILARRPRSEWELRDYLKRKEYSPAVIEETIERLRDHGYVNDAAFATAWVENRRLLKPTSKRRLTQELRQKRVSSEVIEEILIDDATDEQAILKELIERKRRRYPDELKLMRYLAGQGFNYGDIKAVLTELNSPEQ